jgi:hypothetical protein
MLSRRVGTASSRPHMQPGSYRGQFIEEGVVTIFGVLPEKLRAHRTARKSLRA